MLESALCSVSVSVPCLKVFMKSATSSQVDVKVEIEFGNLVIDIFKEGNQDMTFFANNIRDGFDI